MAARGKTGGWRRLVGAVLFGYSLAACGAGAAERTALGGSEPRPSLAKWTGDPYTATLFGFLRQYLPPDFILEHFDVVNIYRAPAHRDFATVSFTLRLGGTIALTRGASGKVGETSLVSGWARIAGSRVEEYTGPLAVYAPTVSAAGARAILVAHGATQIVVPGGRSSTELELWVQDYFRREPPIEEKRGAFWIGAVKPAEEGKWLWVDAESGAIRVEPRLRPH